MGKPTKTEVDLARGIMALRRAHEEANEPSTWHINEVGWGDGRYAYQVNDRNPYKDHEGRQRYTTGLVCIFRPDDPDGSTEQDAQACINAATRGVELARDILDRDILSDPAAEAALDAVSQAINMRLAFWRDPGGRWSVVEGDDPDVPGRRRWCAEKTQMDAVVEFIRWAARGDIKVEHPRDASMPYMRAATTRKE